MVKLAKEIHGDLVPQSTCHGDVEEADPPLSIYSIPYLRGSSCTEVLAFQVEMDPEEEAKHGVFVKHLARQLPHKPDIYSEAILLIFFKVLCAMSVQLSAQAERQVGIRKRHTRPAGGGITMVHSVQLDAV